MKIFVEVNDELRRTIMGCCGSSKKRAPASEKDINQNGQDKVHNHANSAANQKPKVGFWRRLFGQ